METLQKDKKYMEVAKTISSDYNYGEIVHHSTLRLMLDLIPPEYGKRSDFDKYNFALLDEVENLKNELLVEYQILLQAVPATGYMLVHPNSQTNVAMDKLKKTVIKSLRKAKDELTHINTSMLSHDQQKANIEARAKLAALSSMSKQQLIK